MSLSYSIIKLVVGTEQFSFNEVSLLDFLLVYCEVFYYYHRVLVHYPKQGRRIVFRTDQAKFDNKDYTIKCMGGW